jgi:hypothetical protein
MHVSNGWNRPWNGISKEVELEIAMQLFLACKSEEHGPQVSRTLWCATTDSDPTPSINNVWFQFKVCSNANDAGASWIWSVRSATNRAGLLFIATTNFSR